MVQIKNGEIQKMQFAKEEAESQEEIEVSFFQTVITNLTNLGGKPREQLENVAEDLARSGR